MNGRKASLGSFLYVDFHDIGNWIAIVLVAVLFGFSIWMFMR